MRFCNPSDVRALVQTKIKGGMVDQLLASIFSGKSKTAEKTSYEKRASRISAFYDSQSDTFIVGKGVSREIFSVYPIRFNDGQQGFVTVVSSLEAVDEILKTHSRIRLYSLVATTFLLVGAITWLFRTKVYRSVFHLVEVMHRL